MLGWRQKQNHCKSKAPPTLQQLYSRHISSSSLPKKEKEKTLMLPSPRSCSLLFSSFLSTSTAVYWRRRSQYTRIACKASVHQRCHYLSANVKLSFAFSLYNITSFIPNNRTEPDCLMRQKSLELGSFLMQFRTKTGVHQGLEKFQIIPVNTDVCF